MGCFVRGGKKGMGCYVRGDKNSMGCYVRGDKNSMGCFVQGGKSLWDVLSGLSKNGMGCFVPGCFVRLPTFYPRTNKPVKILGMSLRLKKVCPVYNTYPITELKMYWLIQWHLCAYRGVKVWSFSYLRLLSVNN